MKIAYYLMSVAPLALAAPAFAADPAATAETTAATTEVPANKQETFTTGVARARDALDSAISTSTLTAAEIEKAGARSLGEIFRNIPGMRSESAGGEGNVSISIRGLPIALGGAKFLQLQENGLPTLEFGDIAFGTADNFLRADLNTAGVQAIRGGSASTFASNSPGGIVNLIDKTGEVEGGAIQSTIGLDYESYRTDFDYGARINDTLRFHVGGFYRTGEGPRATGFDAYKGGQFKFNITKNFTGGYIRVYGKLLDDRTPSDTFVPVAVSGTNANPQFRNLANFNVAKDTLLSPNIPGNITLDENNRLVRHPFNEGYRAKMKSIGVETQFEISDWTITDKFRFSDISGSSIRPYLLPGDLVPFPIVGSASTIATMFGGPGARLSYATGPNSGQAIMPATLNGNGLAALVTTQDTRLNSLNNVTNDLRASKVWKVGEGDLTTTMGFYKAKQDIHTAWTWGTIITDVVGGGNASLLNLTAANGAQVTQNGFLAYSAALAGNFLRNVYDVSYDVNAPYGSVNYHIGRLAIGASVRYDYGNARGTLYGSTLLANPNTSVISYDVNGDGVITPGSAETRVGTVPLSNPAPVNYKYNYVSYSAGVNYRVAENFSVFGRYSRGGRANADRILFSNYVSTTSGGLRRSDAAYDSVQQAEGGFKFRNKDMALFATGFWAKTKEHNIGLDRGYRAYGVELEGNYRRGIFMLNGGATFTKAKITSDALVPATVGNKPKHQADLIFQITPHIETNDFSVGTNLYGTTSSYAQDNGKLKMPGFAVVNPFVQYRPVDRVSVSVNVNNLFNKIAFVEINEGTIPANGIVSARTLNPRTISTSLRFDF